MKNRLLWKILLNVIPVIGVTILVVWLAIDKLAATYFMRLMEKYSIEPLHSHQMFIESVHRYLVWAALAALILALFLSYLMTRRVLRPLTQMTRISHEFSQGNFTDRVEIVDSDEVGQLGVAFNSMADSLEQLEGLRKRMVTDIAHELRTPLTNLRGYFEGLTDSVVPPSKETFAMLEAETLRLVHLVDDLQQLSKADAAGAFLQLCKVSVCDLIEQVTPLFAPRFLGRNVSFDVDIEPSDIQLMADFDKLLQVLSNLLENALHYTPEGGQVVVLARERGQLIEFEISNTGVQIAENDLPFIFERFYRADRSRSREKGGAGIGLAIVKEIVEAHGGQVEAESDASQTRFRLQLPKHPDCA